MIHSRLTSKAQTTVPQAVRQALGLGAGDDIGWEIEDGRAVVRRLGPAEVRENPFAVFTEWADDLDTPYDGL